MEEQVRAFLDEWVPVIQSLEKEMAQSYWKASTTGESRYEEAYAQAMKRLMTLYADPDTFRRIREFRESDIPDPLLKRQVELLYNACAGRQMTEKEIERIVRLETEIEGIFTKFRPEIGGRRVTDNEIKEILQTEKDTYKRKEAWKASKQVGAAVAERLRELVKWRNQVAVRLGYRDFYQMSLALNEIDEAELFDLLEELKKKTDQPFADMKQEMDKKIANAYPHLRPEGIRPWHYTDPFFQEAPPVFDVDLDGFFREKKLEDIALKTFRGIGLDPEDILRRSDLYEREGKSQHAYCMDMDRSGDVRILCNLRPDAYWMGTLLHELGHGVYDKYHNPELPYLLRTHAHIASTEAIAMLMGRLVKEADWLIRVAGIPEERIRAVAEALRKQSQLEMLIFVRWCLVMVHFERELYRNPDGDLNRLWWDYVEKFQFVPRPESRDASDWAAKIHLGTSPVYYQNYLLGELMASQILHTLCQTFDEGGHPLVENQEAGPFLVEKIFRAGARYPWNELLEKATGEKLNPLYFVNQFIPEEKEAMSEPVEK